MLQAPGGVTLLVDGPTILGQPLVSLFEGVGQQPHAVTLPIQHLAEGLGTVVGYSGARLGGVALGGVLAGQHAGEHGDGQQHGQQDRRHLPQRALEQPADHRVHRLIRRSAAAPARSRNHSTPRNASAAPMATARF